MSSHNRILLTAVASAIIVIACALVVMPFDESDADASASDTAYTGQYYTKTFTLTDNYGEFATLHYWGEGMTVSSGNGLSAAISGSVSYPDVVAEITVSGTPTEAGTVTFKGYVEVDAENEAGDVETFKPVFSVTINIESKTITIDSVGGTEATVEYEYAYSVQTTPADAEISISGVPWLSVSGHRISGTPTSAGSYTLQITASKTGYASASETVVIVVKEETATVGAPTIRDVSYSVDNTNPYRLTFTVSATDASNITLDYGDGSSGTGATSVHTYGSSGSYTVRAVASNASGSVSKSVSVLIADKVPASSVRYNNEYTFTLGIDAEGLTPSVTGCPFLSVTAGSNFVTVSGTPSSTAYVGKTYDVVLTVGSFSMSWTLTVTEGSTSPTAGFSFKTDGLTVTVTSNASNADQTFYQWTSGGSFVQSNTKETRYTYAEAGTYQITQRVTATVDGRTMTNEFTATVTVEAGSSGGDNQDESDDTKEDKDDIIPLAGIVLIVIGIIALFCGAYLGNYVALAMGALMAVLGAVVWWLL